MIFCSLPQNTRVNLKFKDVADKLCEERGLVIQHGGVNEDYRAQITELDPMEAFKRGEKHSVFHVTVLE